MKNFAPLFLSQSYQDTWDDYIRALSSDTFPVWDYVILTASNEDQAEGYRIQLKQRKDRLPSGTTFAVIPDEGGVRVGSGGATLSVLRYVYETEEKKGGHVCRGHFDKLRILVIHSGGDSKRVPTYSALGKLFSPVSHKLPDGRSSSLFDEFMIVMSFVPGRIREGMLVLSGDVLLLFNPLQIDFSGRGAADDMTMTLLKGWCDKNRPELSKLFTLVQEYRKWGKLKSTYIDGYLAHINSATGRIHPDFMFLGTETGRFASRNPNLQNCPRKTNDPIGIRNFIAASPGNVLMSLDFSQIELRVGAFYCRDPKMLDTYRSGGDIHAQTTSVIFGVPFEVAVDKNAPDYKEHRAIAKNCNFGVFYGLFPGGLQTTLRFKAGLDTSLNRCREIINNLKAGYSGLPNGRSRLRKQRRKPAMQKLGLGGADTLSVCSLRIGASTPLPSGARLIRLYKERRRYLKSRLRSHHRGHLGADVAASAFANT